MKIWNAFPELRLEIFKKVTHSQDYTLDLARHLDKHGISAKFIRIGLFVKQPDGTYNFDYVDEEKRRIFSEVLDSEDPIDTFLECHDRLGRKT